MRAPKPQARRRRHRKPRKRRAPSLTAKAGSVNIKKNTVVAAGSRAHPETVEAGKSGQSKIRDPRIGSKKQVALIVSDDTPKSAKPAKAAVPAKSDTLLETRLTPEQELALLENDDRLDALLERLDNGETLSKDEQKWVDSTLDYINALMDELGIKMDDEEEEEEAQQEDIMQLLKRNNPKDVF
ncbi:Der GTPase-activating protein YihI [Symbiopectobacterium sp. RP]|uniref:Der GTPase-activating protein YihI n=1 Tax=Symbiopectobacterium sp. RP TaxID=3248553 RepID=UPI003D2E2F48